MNIKTLSDLDGLELYSEDGHILRFLFENDTCIAIDLLDTSQVDELEPSLPKTIGTWFINDYLGNQESNR